MLWLELDADPERPVAVRHVAHAVLLSLPRWSERRPVPTYFDIWTASASRSPHQCRQTPELFREREPRIELRYDPELLPPMRHPADFAGDPSFARTKEQQRR